MRDIINVISRRTRMHLLLAPARVQVKAHREIVRAIEFLNDHHARAIREGRNEGGIDVILVGAAAVPLKTFGPSMKKRWPAQFARRRFR